MISNTQLENMIAQIKNVLVLVVTFVLGHVDNVKHPLIILFVGFTANFFVGLWADNQHKKKFEMKKAIEGMKLLLFYVIIIFFLYIVTFENKELQKTVMNWLTYIVSYFYLVNVFKNAKVIAPKSQSVKFIYTFLSTEIFIRLKEFIGWKVSENKEKDEQDDIL